MITKKVNLLWTGGWDSTFRLLQLSLLDIQIQPYYFIDKERKSKDIEVERMKLILEKIKDDKRFKAQISEIIFIKVEDVLENMKNIEISNIYRELREKYKLGTQYEWLSLYCNSKEISMELGIEKSNHGKMSKVLKQEKCDLKNIENDFLENRKILGNKKSKVYPMAKYWIYSVVEYSKKDMEEIAKKEGWLDIMKLTWFCHRPIKGKPCGYCNPCKDAMNLGMEWRMPFISKLRYYTLVPLIKLKRKLNYKEK